MSYMKTGDVSSLYTSQSGVVPDTEAQRRIEKTFTRTSNAAIKGHNNVRMPAGSMTVDQCKKACREADWGCKSFDYWKNDARCDLSDKNAADVGGLKTDYEGNPYDHYSMDNLDASSSCMSACYKDKACCGFADPGDGTCQIFTTCQPLKPSFGVTFKAKVSGTEGESKTTISIKANNLAGAETMDVPWLAIDAGVYKTTEGKMIQAGVAAVQNEGGTWQEVSFYKDFPGVPVLIAYSTSQAGKVVVRARTRNVGASKFELSLELPTSGATAGEAETTLEEVSWFAIESGKGVIGGKKYVAEEVQSVDAESGKLEFPSDFFSAPPKVLAAASSADGSTTVGVRLASVSTESIELRLQPDADDAASPMGESVSVFALESPSMGGAAFGAIPAGKPEPTADPVIEGIYEAPLVGEIVAPASENTLKGPLDDARLCLHMCMVEEACHAVVAIPDGLCWLKSKAEGEEREAYPGAQSYVKKAQE